MSYSDNEPTVTAMERVIKQRDNLQAHLASAEEQIATLADDRNAWVSQAKRAEAVVEALQRAHAEHLRTGDYVKLGMAAQDAIRCYEEGK